MILSGIPDKTSVELIAEVCKAYYTEKNELSALPYAFAMLPRTLKVLYSIKREEDGTVTLNDIQIGTLNESTYFAANPPGELALAEFQDTRGYSIEVIKAAIVGVQRCFQRKHLDYKKTVYDCAAEITRLYATLQQ